MRQVFTKLIGNERTKTRFGEAAARRQIPHAMILQGPEGSGRRTLAYQMTAALSCEHRGDANYPIPCGICNTCRRIFNGNYTDFHTVVAEEGRATVGVGEIRALKEDVYLSPNESDFKVYLIEEADKMTPQAQNALLKVLEEPPENVVFFLRCESAAKLLVTVRSRAVTVATERIDSEALKSYLLQYDEAAARLARTAADSFSDVITASEGLVGKAKALLDPASVERLEKERDATLTVLKVLLPMTPYVEVLKEISTLPNKRAELTESLERIVRALADLLARRRCDTSPRIFFREDEFPRFDALSPKRLSLLYDRFSAAHDAVVKNGNVNAILSTLAADIREM